MWIVFFLFKQKTAYEMRISDWSSDGCSSDLVAATLNIALQGGAILLMSPLASETLGKALHSVTGMWNLEDFVGHDMYIVAASAIVYNTVGRLQDWKSVG